MKFLFLIFLLVSCTTGVGVFNGRVVDVSWEGIIFKTCEIDAQYGNESSRTTRFSTKNKDSCDNYLNLVGKDVEFKYRVTSFECFVCGSNDLVD